MHWGLFRQSEAYEEFWDKPDWYLLRTWSEIGNRGQQQANIDALPHSRFYASLINSLGGGKGAEVKSTDFLLYKLEDDNSAAAQIRKLLPKSTITILKQLHSEDLIPSEVLSVIFATQGFEEILLQGV